MKMNFQLAVYLTILVLTRLASPEPWLGLSLVNDLLNCRALIVCEIFAQVIVG